MAARPRAGSCSHPASAQAILGEVRYFTRYESSRLRREYRLRERSRPYRLALLLFPLIALLVLAVELGRAFWYAREVAEFATVIDQTPPEVVQRQVERFAAGLNDINPLVRNASATALKVATHANLGRDITAWRDWWRAHGATWRYLPSAWTNLDTETPVVSPQPYRAVPRS